jgi:predicted flap endonuclease-1-like 5' DNA nuclease
MMNYKIADIEGIGASMTQKLKKAGVKTVQGLLKAGATKKGRKELAEASGIDESVILKWVNMADLYRVKGIGKQYSELLEKAGVDTVKELRTRKAENLVAKIAESNAAGKKRMVRLLPGLKRVESWIEEAKKLEPMVTY